MGGLHLRGVAEQAKRAAPVVWLLCLVLQNTRGQFDHPSSTPVHDWLPACLPAGEVVVATTRVETMLGDTAVAVHPEDPR